MNLKNKNKLLLFSFFFCCKTSVFTLLSSSSRPNDEPGIYTKNLEKILLFFFFPMAVCSVYIRAEYFMTAPGAACGIDCVHSVVFFFYGPVVNDKHK